MPEIDIGSFLQTLVQRSRLMVAHQIQSSQFFPVQVKKILRKSQLQTREKLRKLSLRKKVFFL